MTSNQRVVIAIAFAFSLISLSPFPALAIDWNSTNNFFHRVHQTNPGSTLTSLDTEAFLSSVQSGLAVGGVVDDDDVRLSKFFTALVRRAANITANSYIKKWLESDSCARSVASIIKQNKTTLKVPDVPHSLILNFMQSILEDGVNNCSSCSDDMKMWLKIGIKDLRLLVSLALGDFKGVFKSTYSLTLDFVVSFYNKTLEVADLIPRTWRVVTDQDYSCDFATDICIDVQKYQRIFDEQLVFSEEVIAKTKYSSIEEIQIAVDRVNYIYDLYEIQRARHPKLRITWPRDVYISDLHVIYESKQSLVDIQDSDCWYYDYVHYLLVKKVINGYGDNTFKPSDEVNRAEFTKMLMRGYEVASGTAVTHRYDLPAAWNVSPAQWYYSFLLSAYNKTNVMTGEPVAFWDAGASPDGGWGAGVTRYEAIYMLRNLLSLPSITDISGNPFQDMSSDQWLATATLYLYEIISGYPDKRFQPARVINRAEAAAVIYNMMQYVTVLQRGMW